MRCYPPLCRAGALILTGLGLAIPLCGQRSIRFNATGGNGWRLWWHRHARIPRPALSARDRRAELWIYFWHSATDFTGSVSIRSPSNVNGVYGAAGAGVAVGRGAGVIVLTNQNCAVLTLSGRQAGLIVAADLNGLIITIR